MKDKNIREYLMEKKAMSLIGAAGKGALSGATLGAAFDKKDKKKGAAKGAAIGAVALPVGAMGALEAEMALFKKAPRLARGIGSIPYNALPLSVLLAGGKVLYDRKKRKK